ncbi:DUF4333 domain-containing protein [Pseudonocardia acidicola]|uniref:DUF4333 domain-containing protein n=1 Tax=Pseudonocardia acidicola TaxID=2724939 RepID=A0ABX1SC30_9PSEU|nr:DUF4333 domain-containing protein [Pseudonocardia acidicola]NMH98097.1 DUF4333 domain-containing protein [Pseudonocardia acidicola]
MSTPQGSNPPHGNSPDQGDAGAAGSPDQPAEQPVWGQQPAGGWGQQAATWNQQGWDQQGGRQAWPQQGWGQPQAGQQAWTQPQGQAWGPQPTPQWDQQSWGPQPTQQTAAVSKKRLLPLIVVAAAVLVIAVVGVLGFWKPGFFNTRVFDQTALQNGVQQVLTRDYGHEVSNVSCGQNIEVTTGATFTCDATVDGERLKVPVKVTSDDGHYEVGRV